MDRILAIALAGLIALAGSGAARQKAIDPKTLTQDELFTTTRIWDAALTFTPEQWKGLEPTQQAPPGRMYFPGDPLLGSPGNG